MRCEICNKNMKNFRGKVSHIRGAHDLSYLEYAIKYEDFKIPKCKICGENAKQKNNIDFRETCGSKECISKSLSIKHSEESKKNLSNKRKEYLKNNKNKHNWSIYHNQETEPEKRFREALKNINIKSYQYFIPNESDRFYEMDFAIPSMKIDFEINGEQHYDRNGKLTKYYQDRHDYLTNLGWKVIEIHYSLCFDNNKIRDIILNATNNNVVFSEKICNEAINYRILKKKNREKETNKNNQKNISNKIRSIQEEFDRFYFIIELINNYGEKIGLINHLSEKLKVSHTQTRRILKKYQINIELRKEYRIK